jgi:hypothetical protein
VPDACAGRAAGLPALAAHAPLAAAADASSYVE